MLYSMTGFGTASAETEHCHIKVEIKTLNSKFLDLNQKIPRKLADRESDIKNMITKKLVRGKINLAIELVPVHPEKPVPRIDKTLFKKYYEEYRKLAKEVGAKEKVFFKLALHSPGVIVPAPPANEVEWDLIKSAVARATDKCLSFRASEGKALQEKISGHINEIRNGLREVAERDVGRIGQVRGRIVASIDGIKDKIRIDQNRFEQELIYYLEKIDIAEEKARLEKHLEYFEEVLEDKESQGKKLGFISQEIGREINTIGSKANDAAMQRAVVGMKDELEKIKEQILNII